MKLTSALRYSFPVFFAAIAIAHISIGNTNLAVAWGCTTLWAGLTAYTMYQFEKTHTNLTTMKRNLHAAIKAAWIAGYTTAHDTKEN